MTCDDNDHNNHASESAIHSLSSKTYDCSGRNRRSFSTGFACDASSGGNHPPIGSGADTPSSGCAIGGGSSRHRCGCCCHIFRYNRHLHDHTPGTMLTTATAIVGTSPSSSAPLAIARASPISVSVSAAVHVYIIKKYNTNQLRKDAAQLGFFFTRTYDLW